MNRYTHQVLTAMLNHSNHCDGVGDGDGDGDGDGEPDPLLFGEVFVVGMMFLLLRLV